nr:MAG TPA: hypothetical protein [Caudoviricetes sp.]
MYLLYRVLGRNFIFLIPSAPYWLYLAFGNATHDIRYSNRL